MGINYSKNSNCNDSEDSTFNTSFDYTNANADMTKKNIIGDVNFGNPTDLSSARKERYSSTRDLILDKNNKKIYCTSCYENLMTTEDKEFNFYFITEALNLMTIEQLSKRTTQIDLEEIKDYDNKLKYIHAIINLTYRRLYNNITETPTGEDIYEYFINQNVITEPVKENLMQNKIYVIFEFSRWIWTYKVLRKKN